MKIALLATGRFHVCDLARELDALGHEVAFYSLVPPWRTRTFGLPWRCNRWLLPFLVPIYAAARAMRGTFAENAMNEKLLHTFDAVASRLIARCDVFIGMSGMSTRSAEACRRKYGARILIERGSQHIISQREILESISRPPGSPAPVPDSHVRRELADYEIADTIVVPSRHVVKSFVEQGFQETRLFRNPYGVNLEMFPVKAVKMQALPTVLMVGTWSLRKGGDVLVQAWRKLHQTRLLHVGQRGDLEYPREPWFEHRPAVNQSRLTDVYAEANVLGLASREEGLALVQAQALASGLPVVCTERTGGSDLDELLQIPGVVTVVPPNDGDALSAALHGALERSCAKGFQRDILGVARERLSWRAYGERYHRWLLERA